MLLLVSWLIFKISLCSSVCEGVCVCALKMEGETVLYKGFPLNFLVC